MSVANDVIAAGTTMSPMNYRISPRYRWHLRFWAVAGALMAVLAVVKGASWAGGASYRIALVVVFTVIAAFLFLQDYRLRVVIQTDDRGIHLRGPLTRSSSIGWVDISTIVNYASHGFLQITSTAGGRMTISHHLERVQDLVHEIVTRTGRQIDEK